MPHARRRYARGVLLAVTAILTVPLTACGDSDTVTSEPQALRTAPDGDVFNDSDVAFLVDMIPHHAQAVQLVVLAQDRPLDPEVRAIAESIRATQVPEVELMSDWLTGWGEEVPATSLDHTNAGHDGAGTDGADHGDMPGMLSAAEVEALAGASDAEFQETWLELMIEHHRGAVQMAETQQAEGAFADAVALAESIESTQEAEISSLEDLLG